MGPGRRCRGTVGPAHRMKWANMQSSSSEHGSGVAESGEWREEACGRGAKRVILSPASWYSCKWVVFCSLVETEISVHFYPP